jgi:dTDP-4-amino-4,6-dideoxygalactose transaminase
VDIEKDSHLIDPAAIEDAITKKTRGIIPVHLYGMCADMDRINKIAKKYKLFVLEDACQAHGALYKGKSAGSLGDVAAFSFYPTKNLGAYGDGGCVTTNNEGLYKKVLLLRNYGQTDRYHYEIPGYNSRLDEIQAAILRVKLQHLNNWIEKRRKIAARYDQGLKGINFISEKHAKGSTHVYHLYVIAVEKRDELKKHLADKGIETLIHYPVPLHKQKIFDKARVAGTLENTDTRASQILSLPFHPWLADDEIGYVINAVKVFYR